MSECLVIIELKRLITYSLIFFVYYACGHASQIWDYGSYD